MTNIIAAAEVSRLAQAAGFRGDALITAIAIAKAESNFDADALGDTTIQTKKWGPSVGLWQIRSLNAEQGSGRLRDAARLTDPAFNARSAYAISGGGVDFTPWSVFTTTDSKKSYKRFLSLARTVAPGGAIGAVAGVAAGTAVAERAVPGSTIPSGQAAVPGGPPVLAAGTTAAGPPLLLRIGSSLDPGELGNAVTGGSIDFSTSEVSQMTVVLDDPDYRLLQKHGLNIGTVVDNYGIRWQVVELESGQSRAREQVTLRCHPAGAVRLRESIPSASRISPTLYMAALARQAGLRFIGEPTAPRDIAPAEIDDTRGRVAIKRLQTAWEVGVFWAGELGFLFFEAGATLYFGSPRYLAEQGRRAQISWRGLAFKTSDGGPVYPALNAPKCKATGRTFFKKGAVIPGFVHPDGLVTTTTYLDTVDRLEDITVKAEIERATGEALRPGMRTALAGVPLFDSTTLLMTRVSWSLSDVYSPVTVEAASAQVLPGAGRLPEDDEVSFGVPSAPPGKRLTTSDRIRYFGQPGDRVRATTVTVFGIKVTVHSAIVRQFEAACADAAKSSTWRPVVIGSYVVRPVRGGSSPSLHGFGLAFDFYNKSTVVTYEEVWGTKHAPDAAFREAFKRHGFHLGSDFSRRKDYPHIEWASAPPDTGVRRPAGAATGPQP